jgi:hypothetical protein
VAINRGGICDAIPGRGLAGGRVRFTARGRQTLKEFGAVVDEMHGKRALFLTWTLPGDGPRQIAALAAWSSYISSQLNQWLRDTVTAVMYAWVYEFQQRGALHQHLMVSGPHWGQLIKCAMLFPRFMRQTLERVSALAGVDLFCNEIKGTDNREHFEKGIRAEWVAKSAARYLAKYVSKTANAGATGLPLAPVRWWRVNNRALLAIKARRDSAQILCDSVSDAQEVIKQAVEACTAFGANVFGYANREFPWLKNALISFAEARLGVSAFEALAVALAQTHKVARCSAVDIARAREGLAARVAAARAAVFLAPLAVLCPLRVLKPPP